MNVLYNNLLTIKNSFTAIRDKFKSTWGIDYTGKATADYADMLNILTKKLDKSGQRTSFQNAFAYSDLSVSPPLDTSNAERTNFMYANCGELISIPPLQLPSVVTTEAMFANCTKLKAVEFLEFGMNSNAITAHNMFNGCTALTSIDGFNCSGVTTLNGTFNGCKSLNILLLTNTGMCTNFNNAFRGCSQLKSIDGLDLSYATTASSAFMGCTMLETVLVSGMINVSLSLTDCVNLSHDSLTGFINALVPNSTYGKILNLGDVNLSKLTDVEKEMAAEKRWALT